MMIFLKTEEEFAAHQRTMCPDLIDNVVEDMEAKVVTDIQMTRMMIRTLRALTADEKRVIREAMLWDLYDRKLKDGIH
jgi:hypothetical protein